MSSLDSDIGELRDQKSAKLEQRVSIQKALKEKERELTKLVDLNVKIELGNLVAHVHLKYMSIIT